LPGVLEGLALLQENRISPHFWSRTSRATPRARPVSPRSRQFISAWRTLLMAPAFRSTPSIIACIIRTASFPNIRVGANGRKTLTVFPAPCTGAVSTLDLANSWMIGDREDRHLMRVRRRRGAYDPRGGGPSRTRRPASLPPRTRIARAILPRRQPRWARRVVFAAVASYRALSSDPLS